MALNNEDLRAIVIRVVDYELNTQYVANQFGITVRRVQQLANEYRRTGIAPELRKRGRRPRSDYPEDLEDRVIRAKKKFRISAVGIGHYLRKRYSFHVGNDKIHNILLENGFATENLNMRVRKKPWIRYERSQSLSAVHMDWHLAKNDEWVCFVEDDSSRKILAGGEYERRSSEAAIDLLGQVITKYDSIRRVREVITDHGSEFYANTRDKNGNADHQFENFCRDSGIKQILCRYNHPQSNGKIEKWFDTYDKHRSEFETLEDYIHWYNEVRPHMSLDYKNLETPEQAFWERLRGYLVGAFMEYCEREMEA
ncbi:MAG: DDE-type integrase/transposase/recombinase [Candidatus Thermoplasmatota archaeon]|nr:DDE-type integrase/transposase/recombinase [Candidatus Thermoplasmatota archaeon]